MTRKSSTRDVQQRGRPETRSRPLEAGHTHHGGGSLYRQGPTDQELRGKTPKKRGNVFMIKLVCHLPAFLHQAKEQKVHCIYTFLFFVIFFFWFIFTQQGAE